MRPLCLDRLTASWAALVLLGSLQPARAADCKPLPASTDVNTVALKFTVDACVAAINAPPADKSDAAADKKAQSVIAYRSVLDDLRNQAARDAQRHGGKSMAQLNLNLVDNGLNETNGQFEQAKAFTNDDFEKWLKAQGPSTPPAPLSGGAGSDDQNQRRDAPGVKATPAAQATALRSDPQALESRLDASGASNPAYYRGVGDIYESQGREDDAERSYHKAVKLKPDAESYAKLAQISAVRGDRAGAETAARQALALDPGQPLAKLVLGHASELTRSAGASKLAGKGAFGEDKAERAGLASGGSEGRPGAGAAPAAAGPSVSQSATGDRERAMSLVTAPVGLSPLVAKALREAQLGDNAHALLLLAQAVDADPKDAGAWMLRSELENASKDYAAAEADAGRALALNPPPALAARALRARAFAYLQDGKPDLALADAERAAALEPANGLAFLYKGMAEAKLGRAAAAIADLRRAVELDPTLRSAAAPVLASLGVSDAPAANAGPSARVGPKLLRGGLIAGSLLLVLIGLLGRSAAKAVTRRPVSASAANATLVDEAAPLSPGALIGGSYRVSRELGRGGMGVVYEALDETLQRRVALKQMQGGSPEEVERFLREARLVAQLKHPRIAEIHNVLLEREPLLVFELVEGRTLDAVLAERGRLSVAAAQRVVAEVCEALEYAHGRGIVHRDLKPSNVMVSADGSCKVMDFGIAHQSRSAATQTRTVASGTPAYMAPEQGLGSVSKAADLYALAVVAYELLTGARPFAGPDFLEQKLQKRFSPLSVTAAALPAELDAFFARALEADPTKRFPDAAAFRQAFDAACGARAL